MPKKTSNRKTPRTSNKKSSKNQPAVVSARTTPIRKNSFEFPTIDRSRSFFLIVVLIVAIAGIFMLVPRPLPGSTTATTLQHVISYPGQDGKTALDLLKASHQVAAQQFSIGAFVTSIDGISAPSNYFWAFKVNGKPSDIGADQYVTKNSDTLSWQLEPIQ